MPELPEVETMCRGIRPIIGRTVERVEVPPCHCRPITIEPKIATLQRRLRDRQVADIQRRGKRVMLCFDDASRLVIEPRMTGLVLLADPPDPDHLRLRIQFKNSSVARSATDFADELLVWDRRGLGTIRWMNDREYRVKIDERLGADALHITADQLKQNLGLSRRPVKVALLDQAAVAGIGNLYAAEILFLAGVDPRTRCDRLTQPQWQRIHAAIGEVLHDAIAHEGSTLSDGTYRNALNDPGGYQNMHRVYDREHQSCPRCETGVVRRIVQAQRSTFFCAGCQRKSGKHPSIV
ncbi:bifunctional DNA-formamidopyrimidine glycosylase/DNA-(apurinic or apyrimidinic site) lyase [Rhodopirellula sp. JC740]|uniref:Formamidopyrimidine-DNA glycosylase n=1 Tax=Rhodopirellula halodulae TaxID=2894198 RepID=A0ABS8NLB6_9BACT|nr:bifunctional DNA-formamidopyrimidine glycosylase/DNA-(apurinic or apyrimidinic site) lyase [Rhodopirellula sp. JC740]MCC9644301.1 bifunctional DNA-formamidopyrimidine glycosylase/DNA-(apurinic or apyrimidinic site) lyase [Rhodopirellula sp. JC740]